MPARPEPPSALTTNQVDDRISELFRTLGHLGPMTTERISLPATSIALQVTRPTEIDRLLDQASTDPEQNLPYWAEVWPSGIALAAAIARNPERIAGRRVIELGCGLGITAALAVASGARLTVTDYAPESLALTRITTLRHTGREPESCHRINWRSSDALHTLADGAPFSVVLAADVVYERRDVEPLIAAVEVLLEPGGVLWLADPHREPTDIFLERLRAPGWHAETTRWMGPWPDPGDAGVTVRTHLISRSNSAKP